MSFLDMLQDLGDRLGILEAADAPAAQATVKIKTRTVTLADLATEIKAEEVRALADLPAELTIPFEKIFEAAGVGAPEHGWNIDRLKDFLLAGQFKDMEHEAAQKAVLKKLGSESIPVEDLVRDAMARDKALDSFESFTRKKVEGRMAACERRLAEIEAQIKSLQTETRDLQEKSRIDQEKWREWRRQKRARERELAWTVGFVIDRQVITTDDDV